MAQFNADILLNVQSTGSERQVKRLERSIQKVEDASRDILDVDKKIVRERRILLTLSGQQATRAKKRLTDLRLQKSELTLQKRELQQIARLERQRTRGTSAASNAAAGVGDGGSDGFETAFGTTLLSQGQKKFQSFQDEIKEFDANYGKLVRNLVDNDDRLAEAASKNKAAQEKLIQSVQKRKAAEEKLNRIEKFGSTGGKSKAQALRDARNSLEALTNWSKRYREEAVKTQAALRGVAREAEAAARETADLAAKPLRRRAELARLQRSAVAGLAFANVPGQDLFQAAGAGALVGGPKGAAIAATVAALAKIASLGPGVARTAAELERLEIALRGVAGTNTAQALEVIDGVVNDFNQPITAATRNFTQLAAASNAAGLSLKDQETIFRGLSAANKALGKDSENLSGILNAAVQVLSKGTVQAEELRGQIGDRLPGAVALFATAIGKTTAELDQALKDGEVSVKDFVTFTESLLNRYERNAKKIADGPADAGARLQTALANLQKALGPILTKIGADFQNLATTAVNSLTAIANAVNNAFNLGADGELKTQTAIRNTQDKLIERFTKQLASGGLSANEAASVTELLNLAFKRRNLAEARIREINIAGQGGARQGDGVVRPLNPFNPDGVDTGDFQAGVDAARAAEEAAERAAEQRRIELRDQGQLLERLTAQIKLESSITDIDRITNQLALDQLEIRQDIENRLEGANDQMKELLKREAELRNRLAIDVNTRPIFDAGYEMGKALAEEMSKVKTEINEIDILLESIGNTAVNGLVNGITTAVEGLVKGVEDLDKALQELLAGVLADIGRQLISFGINTALSSLGGNDGVGLFSKLFPQRAEGGPVMADRPYLIGERGPELFIPGRSGEVVSNEDTRSLSAAMSRYTPSGRSGGSSGAGGDLTAGGGVSGSIDVSYNVTEINQQRYVSEEQFQAGIKAAAEQGAAGGYAKTMTNLKNNRSTRAKLGL